MTHGWACFHCPDHGTTTATKTGRDDAARHGDATGHSTTTATTADAAVRLAGRVGAR